MPNYICNVCGVGFHYAINLTCHMRRHSSQHLIFNVLAAEAGLDGFHIWIGIFISVMGRGLSMSVKDLIDVLSAEAVIASVET